MCLKNSNDDVKKYHCYCVNCCLIKLNCIQLHVYRKVGSEIYNGMAFDQLM